MIDCFQAAGLVPHYPERVLSSLTVVRTPSPPGTTADTIAWTAETPRTVDQLQQQARHVQNLLQRQSQSPTSQAIRQLVKGCQLAMQSATILAEENSKLQALNHHRRQRKDKQRRYIARGGALQVQHGQQLAVEADRVVVESDQAQTTQGRQRTTNVYQMPYPRTQQNSM
ncbi:hypothetical protein P3342_004524 [Pyrenophora teres f. teres]|nr:hypothetical protein P3342_004524 [Pyrenophora teres f. teres]